VRALAQDRRAPRAPSAIAILLDELDEIALRDFAERLRPYLVDNTGRLLDAREAAAMLGLHPDTLVRMARTGRIRAVKAGRAWRFRADQLDISPSRQATVSALPSAPRRRLRVATRPSVAAIRAGASR
jgi:excisionase family DNA binding protein